ncbi:MAG: putative ABC transport system permease protein [Saprospiraceae bacterium]|jgi:putative ABC transport system permease protein
MLKSYFKLAFKVLNRKRFFTFISLFGISFTLMILMLVTAFLDNELGQHAPMTEKDRMVFMDHAWTKLMLPDTTYIVDSTYVKGAMLYDSTMEVGEAQRSMSRSQVSYYLFEDVIGDVQGAQRRTAMVPFLSFSVFKNNKKLELGGMGVDPEYWNIFDFEFTEGSGISIQDFKNSKQVAVITEEAARDYFGKKSGVVGLEMELDKKRYEVVGVIKKPDTNHDYVSANVFIPHSVLPDYIIGGPEDLLTSFQVAYLAENEESVQVIKDDLDRIAENYVMPNPERRNRLGFDSATFVEFYSDEIMDMETIEESTNYAKGILFFLLSMFVILPTLNLININTSRILERASEIGVRKSFGANTNTILTQFIFENIILTLIGGFIGLVLAAGLIYMINTSDWLNGIQLSFNLKIFIYSFLITLFFGILSGLIPAYKMAKMQIVTSLKSSGK